MELFILHQIMKNTGTVSQNDREVQTLIEEFGHPGGLQPKLVNKQKIAVLSELSHVH